MPAPMAKASAVRCGDSWRWSTCFNNDRKEAMAGSDAMSGLRRKMLVTDEGQRTAAAIRERHVEALSRGLHRADSRGANTVAGRGALETCTLTTGHCKQQFEIGRASCRERV